MTKAPVRVKSEIHSVPQDAWSPISLARYGRSSQLDPTLTFLASSLFTICPVVPTRDCYFLVFSSMFSMSFSFLLFSCLFMHVLNALLFLHLTNSYSAYKGSTQKLPPLWKLCLIPALSKPQPNYLYPHLCSWRT